MRLYPMFLSDRADTAGADQLPLYRTEAHTIAARLDSVDLDGEAAGCVGLHSIDSISQRLARWV